MRSLLGVRLGIAWGWLPLVVLVLLGHVGRAEEKASEKVSSKAGEAAELIMQAVAGKPFGVAKVTMLVPRGKPQVAVADGDFQIREKSGRVFYPALNELLDPADEVVVKVKRSGGNDRDDDDTKDTELNDFAKNNAGKTADLSRTFYFLFTGNEPLDFTIRAGKTYHGAVEPKAGQQDHDQLAREWLTAFAKNPSIHAPETSEVPPLVDNYLAAMLARRMKLDYQPRDSGWFGLGSTDQSVGLLLGSESIRTAMAKDLLLKPHDTKDVADQPLPRGFTPPVLEIPEIKDKVAIEPMAYHVPHECFYVRFGSFENFQWARSTVDEWGGDLRNLASARAIDYQTTARIERQLLLKETALAKVFGPKVIADVAIVGHDTFLREGSSLGIIFQAKNNSLLAASLGQQRSEALKQPGVKEEQVNIDGHDVSLISSADNRVRSFYAVDGDFHLVTNSKTLARRFYEAGRDVESLARANEFRYARKLMPVDRGDAAFVFLSDEFFRALVGPKYRVEMTRRTQAQTELELIQVAKLAAKVEHVPGDTVEQLVAANLLPAEFGKRPDGSHPVQADKEFVDSLRGARGAFLPVADVTIDKVTAAEAESYFRFAESYMREWKNIDPAMLGVQHRAVKDPSALKNGTGTSQSPETGKENNGPLRASPIFQQERIVLDVHIAPYAKQHYGGINTVLGPATKTAIAAVPGDLASIQGVGLIPGEFKGTKDPIGPFHAFIALRDHDGKYLLDQFGPAYRDGDPYTRGEVYGGVMKGTQMIRGFIAWESDKDGVVETVPYVGHGFHIGDFDIVATKKEVLKTVGPQLHTFEAERPAQIRFHLGDVSKAKLAEVAKLIAYARADQISHGNTRFLHNLALQLGVPAEQCLSVTENLLDGKLVCPLGGKYELHESAGQLPRWTSSKWIEIPDLNSLKVPDGYIPPPLSWFRGLDIESKIDDINLEVHAEITVQRK